MSLLSSSSAHLVLGASRSVYRLLHHQPAHSPVKLSGFAKLVDTSCNTIETSVEAFKHVRLYYFVLGGGNGENVAVVWEYVEGLVLAISFLDEVDTWLGLERLRH